MLILIYYLYAKIVMIVIWHVLLRQYSLIIIELGLIYINVIIFVISVIIQ